MNIFSQKKFYIFENDFMSVLRSLFSKISLIIRIMFGQIWFSKCCSKQWGKYMSHLYLFILLFDVIGEKPTKFSTVTNFLRQDDKPRKGIERQFEFHKEIILCSVDFSIDLFKMQKREGSSVLIFGGYRKFIERDK